MIIERYYFLFAIALVWLVFASVQDMRKREIANWLCFSLIAFALGYRLIYSAYFLDWNFFLFGFGGFVMFYLFGLLAYYSGAFGGGDAKLLMGLGAILPIESLGDFIYVGVGFIIILAFVGAIYSLVYSLFVVFANPDKFRAKFRLDIRKIGFYYYFLVSLVVLLLFLNSGRFMILISGLILLMPLLYAYTKAADFCLTRLVSGNELEEGDWILGNINVNGKLIKNNVNGLEMKDIKLLRASGRKVLVRYGVPFALAFLISFLIMVFFLVVLQLNFEQVLFSLSFLF